jgi:hypothetical protein
MKRRDAMRFGELTSLISGRTQPASKRHGAGRTLRVIRVTMNSSCATHLSDIPTAFSGGVDAASVREENAL